MEDLRTKTKKKSDTIIEKQSFPINNEDLNNKYYKKIGNYILKNYKRIILYIVLLFIVMYPYEIGKFIGDWIKNFRHGILD